MTLQEMIDRALSIASRGLEPSVAASLNAEMVAEDLLASIFHQTTVKLASDETRKKIVRAVYSVNIGTGSGTVPLGALTQFAHDSNLNDPNDPSAEYTFEPEWNTYSSPAVDQRVGRFTVFGETLLVLPPGAVYTPGTGVTAAYRWDIATVPAVPSSPSTTLSIASEVLDDYVWALAEALRPPMRPVRAARM